MQQLKPCPSTSMGADTSIISYSSGWDENVCNDSNHSLYLIEDTRFGIYWHTVFNSISITAEAVEPAPSDMADSMKSCFVVGPNEIFVDEWLVEKGMPCKGRGSLNGRHHRYTNSRVCLIGTYNCILVSLLKPAGQARVAAALNRMHSRKTAAK